MKQKSVFIKKRIAITKYFMVVLAGVILFSDSVWETKGIIGDILFSIGAVLASIATVGRIWCSAYISGYKVNTLITGGPYSMCRNPLYFFSLLGSAGVGFATETFSIPLVILISFAVQYSYVIDYEEKRLLTEHKSTFDEYMKKVPKFFPSFKLYQDTEEYIIKPQIFRKRLFDSLWFVWLLGVLELIEALHNYRIIPTFIRLY